MDIIYKIKSNIIGPRIEQLKKQEEQDALLRTLKRKCPLVLVDFFLFQRNLNRQNTKKLHKTSLFDIYNTMNDNIRVIDKSDEKINAALHSNNPCKNIALLYKS